jgi:hypothetical protein
VAVGVLGGGVVADEVPPLDEVGLEVCVVEVDAGVDDGDAQILGAGLHVPRGGGADLGQCPLR